MSSALPQAFDLTVGATIDRYEIVRHLGVGAMGTVYLARDPTLDREVAIKLLRVELLERKDLVTRFRREAKAVAKINHRHVVQIFDTGEHDGSPYFVMEYLEGIDCGCLGKDYGSLPEAVVAAIGRDAAEGLAAAADAGVIHRDVKPANLVATTPGPIKVTDFGLAKTRLAASLSAVGELTIQGATLGTPDYMSPEQAVGAELDVNTDIYSLGATLFALLSGRPPFRSLDEEVGNMEVITRHVTTTPPDLASLVPDADAALVATITQMMARAPEDRLSYEMILKALSPLAETLEGAPLAALRSRPTRPPMASGGNDSPVSPGKVVVSTGEAAVSTEDDPNEASLITALAASPQASMTGGLQV
ncbi:MAG: serine/threonine protein kinase, partial [Deltaproteobacteria bacterium]|nr:serine/threonine protein kinase [Deltaproteobacteria bacterium]